MQNIDVGIFILFYEKVDQTIECIKSFLPSGFKIYILNNNSSASSRSELGEFCNNYDQIKIFDSDTNLGVGVGRNYLIENTTENWMFFVDNDIIVKTSDWFEKFCRHREANPDIEAFIPKLYNLHQSAYEPFKPLKVENSKVYFINTKNPFINSFPGGCSIVNRALFNRIGLYDKEIFVALEDFEMSIRAVKSGKPIRSKLVYDIELLHDHRQVVKDEDKDAAKVRYSLEKIENSHKRIYEKYGIILQNDGKSWTKEQLEITLNGKSFLLNLKIHTKNFLRKIRDCFIR